MLRERAYGEFLGTTFPDAQRITQRAAHLQLLPGQVEGAFQYYQAYPEEIDHALSENRVGFERLKQMLPQMERITVSLHGDASAETGA